MEKSKMQEILSGYTLFLVGLKTTSPSDLKAYISDKARISSDSFKVEVVERANIANIYCKTIDVKKKIFELERSPLFYCQATDIDRIKEVDLQRIFHQTLAFARIPDICRDVFENATIRIAEHFPKGEKKSSTLRPGEKAHWQMAITNIAGYPMKFESVSLIPKEEFWFSIPHRRKEGFSILKGNEKLVIDFDFNPPSNSTTTGLKKVLMGFKMGNEATHYVQKVFNIVHPTLLEEVEVLGRENLDDGKERDVIEGPPSDFAPEERALDSLYDEFLPPKNLEKDVMKTDKYSGMNPWDTPETYKNRLHDLLWVEETAQRKRIRNFDVPGATFELLNSFASKGGEQKMGSYFKIAVKDLSEQRPSVLTGDYVYVWLEDTSDVEFQGIVRQTSTDALVAEFCSDFWERVSKRSNGKLTFNVRFDFSRIPWRRQHYAIEHAPSRALTPSSEASLKRKTHLDMGHLNTEIRSNIDQVGFIVNAFSQPMTTPLLLFGAFGAGKTRTLIELVRLLSYEQGLKILVCTHVNQAADLFIKGLKEELSPSVMIRLYSGYRDAHSIDREVVPYVARNNDGSPYTPKKSDFPQWKVVVTTCTSADRLISCDLKNHFDYIIIDEAAQMLETEALIPLKLASDKTAIILSGDPLQMGPKIHSEFAQAHRLDISLMERLRLLYEKRQFSSIIHLKENYRNAPPILKLISDLFYEGKLVSKREMKSRFTEFRELKKRFPVLFYDVQGNTVPKSQPPSYLNMEEALKVVEIVRMLLYQFEESRELTQNDIMVTSGFAGQVIEIRQQLRKAGFGRVSVESTRNIQGKEFMILIISTVRANGTPELITRDLQFNVGLVKDHRAMATCFSRASELLIVVGDGKTLELDPKWKQFIATCQNPPNPPSTVLSVLQKPVLPAPMSSERPLVLPPTHPARQLNRESPEFTPQKTKDNREKLSEKSTTSSRSQPSQSSLPASPSVAPQHFETLPSQQPQEHQGPYSAPPPPYYQNSAPLPQQQPPAQPMFDQPQQSQQPQQPQYQQLQQSLFQHQSQYHPQVQQAPLHQSQFQDPQLAHFQYQQYQQGFPMAPGFSSPPYRTPLRFPGSPLETGHAGPHSFTRPPRSTIPSATVPVPSPSPAVPAPSPTPTANRLPVLLYYDDEPFITLPEGNPSPIPFIRVEKFTTGLQCEIGLNGFSEPKIWEDAPPLIIKLVPKEPKGEIQYNNGPTGPVTLLLKYPACVDGKFVKWEVKNGSVIIKFPFFSSSTSSSASSSGLFWGQ